MTEATAVMICHYEVMELPMTCKADEIKKQYKILALKYHPDRNHGNEEEATLKFKQVAAAYAVLIDPHERTWYDDHRDAILRGGSGVAGDDDDDPDLANVWRFFNSSCYSGYEDDSPTGFYTVYNEAFEEVVECENDPNGSYLEFGTSETPIAEVLNFYVEWENFTSKLNFAWADLYHTVDAPNRATRRLMEKDNQKARDTARKEYTNQVRSLARFVKKCDPRYLNYESECKRRQAEQEALRKAQKTEALQERKQRREKQLLEHENDTEWQELRENERKAAFLLADNEEEEVRTSGMGSGFDPEHEVELQKALRNASLEDSASGKVEAGEDNAAGAEGKGEGEGDGCYRCDLCAKSFDTEAQLNHHNTNRVHRKKVQDLAKEARTKKAAKEKAALRSAPVEA